MKKALLFNIQKFSLHDGPGIRTTVFFKGCPLNCKWCHNPEGISTQKQIMYDNDKCTLCGICVKLCEKKAISEVNHGISTDPTLCEFCGKCVYYCINNAREIVGKEYSIDEIVKEVLKDKTFYEESSGGVTLSGGEPMLQIDAVEELLIALKKAGIHTTVDTSGAVPFSYFERIYRYTDLFLYDIKVMDEEKHKLFVGTTNKHILKNLEKLSELHKNIIIRMPIISGVNDDIDHIQKTIDIVKNLNIKEVNLLPYHNISSHKYRKLNLKYFEGKMEIPERSHMEYYMKLLLENNIKAKIGG